MTDGISLGPGIRIIKMVKGQNDNQSPGPVIGGNKSRVGTHRDFVPGYMSPYYLQFPLP